MTNCSPSLITLTTEDTNTEASPTYFCPPTPTAGGKTPVRVDKEIERPPPNLNSRRGFKMFTGKPVIACRSRGQAINCATKVSHCCVDCLYGSLIYLYIYSNWVSLSNQPPPQIDHSSIIIDLFGSNDGPYYTIITTFWLRKVGPPFMRPRYYHATLAVHW